MNKILILILLAMFPTVPNIDSEAKILLPNTGTTICESKIELNPYRFDITELKERVARVETGYAKNPYILKNRFGYMGIFQFHSRTLKSLVKRGLLDASRRDIKNYLYDPDLQERSMGALIVYNARLAVKYNLKEYIGKEVGGITITMEKILAGSHFLGFYGMKNFLISDNYTKPIKGKKFRRKDGNGVSMVKYLKRYDSRRIL